MNHHADALIIGAGVAGSSAAILLARAGWSVALVEKQRFPRRKVCGECVAASNLPLFDALGVGEALQPHAGAPLRRVAFCVGNAVTVAALPRYAHALHPFGRAIGREHLDTLLLQQAEACGVRVWQPWVVRETTCSAGQHQCTVQEVGSDRVVRLDAPLLIDAHGSWESLPSSRERDAVKRPPGRRRPDGADLVAFKGNFSESRLEGDLLPILGFDGGYGGMVQGAEGQLTLACCIRRDRLQALRREAPGHSAAEVVVGHLRRSCALVETALEHARPLQRWLSVGPIRPGIRDATPAPGRFAIGNAAGEAHPILGEGMSMAVQSAWLLATSLQDAALAPSTPALCGQAAPAYAAAWRRHFRTRIHLAALTAALMQRPAGAAVLQGLFARWPPLLGLGARLAGKTRCAVPDSVLPHPAQPTPALVAT